jgi:hypothetical protein
MYMIALIGLYLADSNRGCIEAPKLNTLRLVTIPRRMFLANLTSWHAKIYIMGG